MIFYTGFSDVSEAQNYSQVRSEDLKSQTKIITGSGTALTVAPGYTFTLSKHPHSSSNTEYTILKADYDLKKPAILPAIVSANSEFHSAYCPNPTHTALPLNAKTQSFRHTSGDSNRSCRRRGLYQRVWRY